MLATSHALSDSLCQDALCVHEKWGWLRCVKRIGYHSIKQANEKELDASQTRENTSIEALLLLKLMLYFQLMLKNMKLYLASWISMILESSQ